MSDEMIERVARALHFDFVDQHGYPNGLPTWDEMPDRATRRIAADHDAREFWQSLARAAIEATTVKGDGLVGWQPIETAPKDGSDVDVWAVYSDGVRPDRGQRYTNSKWLVDGWYDNFGNRLDWRDTEPDADGITCGREVTHWMPLPAAPGEATPEAADTITTLKGEIERRDVELWTLRARDRGWQLQSEEQTAEIERRDAALRQIEAEPAMDVAGQAVLSADRVHTIARQALGSTDNVG